jgi:hypothetical protein
MQQIDGSDPNRKSWRDVIRVHPAADLFPMMSKDELRELGEDIKKNGIRTPIVFWFPKGDPGPRLLIDGRNRLDAAELAGLSISYDRKAEKFYLGGDLFLGSDAQREIDREVSRSPAPPPADDGLDIPESLRRAVS